VHRLQPEEFVSEPVLQLDVLRLNALESVVCILKKDVKTMKLLTSKSNNLLTGKRIKLWGSQNSIADPDRNPGSGAF
jgi:hypothetical protein